MKLQAFKLLFVVLLTFSHDYGVEGWRRRRRRRWTPPPPRQCTVSGWSAWSHCSQLCYIGTKSRTRRIVTAATWGGDCPFHMVEYANCGAINGGCQQICDDSTGHCSCRAGFSQSGYYNCDDIDECSRSPSPCSQICKNTVGSFRCECNTGYYPASSNPQNCQKVDCGSPASQFSACPSNAYMDHISSVCAQVTTTCPSGTTYDEQCFLTCPVNYMLAKITPQQNTKFGENYTAVDFSSVISTITCRKTQKSQSVDVWDVADNQLKQYYCRRSNDPPKDLRLSASVLVEHSAIGTIIGTLSSKDSQPGQTFMYTLQSPSSLLIAQGDKLINNWDDPRLNGNISLNSGKLSVTVRSTDDGVPPMWLERTFQITILDVNDPPEQVRLSNSVVYENATVGMTVGELTAIDGDDPPNTGPHSNFKWELLDSDSGRFAINANKITVASSLVGEAQKLHKIRVRCSDYGNPVKEVTESFIITVVNINDPPSSLHLVGSTILETAKKGTVVGQLVVTEKDGDDVSYDISQSDADTLDKFAIDPLRCQGPGYEYDCIVNVTVKASLDYEAKAWYRLSVHVNDSQTQAFKQFNIEIVNVNEPPTAINLTGSRSVFENAIAGTVVGQFVVTDPDNAKSPSHQTHSCQFNVSRPSDKHYFIISSGSVLKVKGAQQINYEQVKNLTLTITCTDSGHPPLSLSRDFFILVKDVNEAPVNLTLSSRTVDENSPHNTTVGILSSDDPDGPSDVRTYHVIGPANTPFTVGGKNGRTLLVNGPLDHETNPTQLVIVRAIDKGGLFMEKTFKITVNDVNDPPSNLTLPTPYFMENSAERVLISPIVLIDQDGDLPSCFLLDDAGLRVKVIGTNLVVGSKVTDYELLPSPHQLVVKLNCSDGHGMFISKSFIISVKNVNEPPSAVSLSAHSVPENEADSVVGQVKVSDPDMGQQHYCTVYKSVKDVGSNTEQLLPSQFFTINAALKLKTLTALNFEAQHSLDIVINCSDGNLTKAESFTIIVKDVNESPSGLCDTPIVLGIRTSVGAVIADLNGRDPDNENAINDDPSNKTVFIKLKQGLSYSLNPEQNSWPFRIRGNKLYKSAAISQAQNFTIAIEVMDDGVIVSSFSSRGYRYTISTPLSAVFNCTITVSEHQQSARILLEPNHVSITADNGVVVGTLTTVTQNSEETFSYTLVDEAGIPFQIVGNKLVVLGKNGLDVRVSGGVEALIPITITSKGSLSSSFTESFYVTIVEDRPYPANICLTPNTIYENQPADSVVGQMIIDDSSSPLLTCTKQHCCPVNGRHFDYECNIKNPEENEIIPQLHKNVTALFRLDERFRLRTRVRLNHTAFADSNGSVVLQVSCRDNKHPLHFIGKSLHVYVADCGSSGVCPEVNTCPVCQNGGSCQDASNGYSCQCMTGFTGRHCEININECQGVECLNGGSCQDGIASFTCNCVGGFSGELCERQPSLCADCVGDTLCVTFINAAIRCLEKQYQIPILVNETAITTQRVTELEEDIGTKLDAQVTDNSAASARRRRALSNFFYVEILRNVQTVSPGQTLLILTALDAGKNYFPLLTSEACALLANTERSCVENCDILQLVGLPCGQAGPNKNVGGPKEPVSKELSSGGMAGIAVVVVILLIAILFAAVFYYRRKYKRAKHDQGGVSYQAGAEGIDFSNQLYGDNRDVMTSAPSNRSWAEHLRKESDGLLRHNLDPTSVIKRNDIKVMDNPIYGTVSDQDNEFGNPLLGAKSVNLPKEDDIAAAKAKNKEENPYMEPKDGACGGTLNLCYARSSAVQVSLGASGGKQQGDEISRAEKDLESYIKGAKGKVRTSSVHPKNLKRQKSDEKGNTEMETRRQEKRATNRGEVPPSFENPFYSGGGSSGELSGGERTYSTISELNNARPRLPPRPSRRLHEAPSEPLVIQEDHTYEALNFGNSNA